MQSLLLWWQNFKQKIHIHIPPKVAMALVAIIPVAIIAIGAGSTYLIANSLSNDSKTQSAASEDSLVSQKLLKVPTQPIPIPTGSAESGIAGSIPTPTPNTIA